MTWTAQTFRLAEQRARLAVGGGVRPILVLLDLASFKGPKGETVMVWEGDGPVVLADPPETSQIPGRRPEYPLLRQPLTGRPDDKRQAEETPRARGGK